MVFENGSKVIYVVVLGSIYGMLVALLVLYLRNCGDLENIRFEFNPWDLCVSNRIKVGKELIPIEVKYTSTLGWTLILHKS